MSTPIQTARSIPALAIEPATHPPMSGDSGPDTKCTSGIIRHSTATPQPMKAYFRPRFSST